MNGKQRCKILKEIRRQIAEKNGIDLAVSECRHRGDCAGTCPKCEEEVRRLEWELERRRSAGKAVLIAGIAAAAVTASGCVERGGTAASPDSDTFTVSLTSGTEQWVQLDGDLVPSVSMQLSDGETLTIDGISGAVPYDRPSLPALSELISCSYVEIRSMLSGFREEDVLAAWGEYITDTYLDNGGDRFMTADLLIDVYYSGEERLIDVVELRLRS